VGAAQYIATMPGRGYRFVAPVETRATLGQPWEGSAGNGSKRQPDDNGSTSVDRACAINPTFAHASDLFVPTEASMLDSSDQWTSMRVVDVPSTSHHPRAGLSHMHELFERAGYGIVIDGEMTLRFDETVVLLKPGSVVARRGSDHPIETLSTATCRMLFVQVARDSDASMALELHGDI
jgi:hypothetical protein